MSLRIYVSGPITKGDYLINVRRAIDAAEELRAAGLYPYVPHLHSSLWHLTYHRDYEDWMDQDLEWISVCHGLLRLPGESSGADREVARAIELGLPVFSSLAEVVAHAKRAA